MRLLHTSDWHLGQNFMGKSRLPEHRAFFNWLLDTIDQQQIDALLVVGDIFDTATPPSYARTLYHNFIVELNQRSRCQLVIIGGNHDSVATLHETRDLLRCLNTTVVGGPRSPISEQVIALKDAEGETAALLCAEPYLRPRDLITSQAGESSEDKRLALLRAITEHYHELFSEAQRQRYHLGHEQLPIVVTGHLTTVGAELSETVRELYIGCLEAFPASHFPAADYIALGHLHRPQKVAGQDHIRYSGSPLPLSFGEADQHKQVVMVEFSAAEQAKVTTLNIPCFQPLATLGGTLEQIEQALEELATTTDLSSSCSGELWLEIELSSQGYLNDLQQRIHQMTADRPLEVLRIRRQRPAVVLAAEHTPLSLHELSVAEVFEQRLKLEALDDACNQKLRQAFHQVAEDCEQPDLLED